MAYVSPTITTSGATFAQFQAGGLSGVLEQLITANLAATNAPTSAPTLSTSATGGTLPAATYYAVVVETNGVGDTTASPASTGQAISGTLELVVTPAAFQTGNTGCDIYVSNVSNAGPWILVATGHAASAFTLASLPTNSWTAQQPPTINTTGLTATGTFPANNASGAAPLFPYPTTITTNQRLVNLRAGERNNFQIVWDHFAQAIDLFNHGNPMEYKAAVAKLREAHTAFAAFSKLCADIGTLMDSNPGTFHYVQDGIANIQKVRQWP